MKDYEKSAATRRARMETVLVMKRIQDELFDRIKEYIDAATKKALTDGIAFDADEVGKAAAAYGAEPWSFTSKPALEHQPVGKARKR